LGEYDKAERVFVRMDHPEAVINVAELKGNFYLAMKHYKRAIDYYNNR